jgi:peptide deformylase
VRYDDARSVKTAGDKRNAGKIENTTRESLIKETTTMIKPIVKDIFFLSQKSEAATKQDLSVGQDLMDTLRANQDHCVGMAANMIGVKKRVIIVNMGILNVVMYNPVIVRKDSPYETEEGCLSLTGVRKTTRYQNIEVEYYDSSWKKRRQNYSGWTAQIIQHECDHLEGIII